MPRKSKDATANAKAKTKGKTRKSSPASSANEKSMSSNEDERNYGLILKSPRAPNASPLLRTLDLAGPAVKEYTGPSKKATGLLMHDFRGDPPPDRVIGYGLSKTVWSNESHAIVNATRDQHQVREKAKEEYNFTKILQAKYAIFPIVSQIPHLIGKKYKKFVYFSEMAQKVPFRDRADGEFYLRQGFQMFNYLYDRDEEYFMLMLDIKPDNFGIVDRGGPTLIWLDIDTQCIMAVRKRPEKKEFFMKFQQLLLLLTFLYTPCPERNQLCSSFAREFNITKYDLYWVINYVFQPKEVREIAGYHQRFLLSCGLNLSANDTARAIEYGYFITPPYHLKYYLSSNYKLIEDLLPDDPIPYNFDPNY